MSRLPGFVIIGAAKAATSSVRLLLKNHPDVFIAQSGVETRFFARDEVYAHGIDWYASLFDEAAPGALLGECSNVYSERDRFPESAPRLARHLPDARLIYIVRDPLPRIASLWTQLRSHGGEQVHHDFPTALDQNRELLIESTRYWRQLEPYRERFDDAQIRILFFEDFAADPGAVMAEVCAFLGIAPLERISPEDTHENRSSGKVGAPTWLSLLRGSPLFRLARRAVPERLRTEARERWLFREIPRPVFTPELRARVLDRIREDSLALLAHCKREPGLWTLD